MVSDDELEKMLERKPSAREAKVEEHVLMFRTLEHPIRRKLIKAIGVFGKKRNELQKELGLNNAMFNFQIDFLRKGGYLKIEGDTLKLTDKGLALLSNI